MARTILSIFLSIGVSACGQSTAEPDVSQTRETQKALLKDRSAVAGARVSQPRRQCLADLGEKINLPGGSFQMGSDAHYRDEAPVRAVSVGEFAIDAHEVTNAQFADFVADTGYKTIAERTPDPALHPEIPPESLVPGSAVFLLPDAENPVGRWAFVAGAAWHAPGGPGTSVAGRENEPVVHIAYEDAQAYVHWAGGNLPTEAQWEYAARGGLIGATYAWGETHPDKLTPPRANTWQGIFPVVNKADDGYASGEQARDRLLCNGAAPVGCYQPNEFGLHDMTGNVWEWVRYADETFAIVLLKPLRRRG